MPEIIYLAAPYSSESKGLREWRVQRVNEYAAELIRAGKMVFSPLSHSHPIAEQCDLGLGFEYWRAFDLEMLRRCDRVHVLTLDGWNKSLGVMAEISEANKIGLEVHYIKPSDSIGSLSPTPNED